MNDVTSRKPLLETAWRRYATLDNNAINVQNQYVRWRKLMAVLGVLAVLLAILVDNYSDNAPLVVTIILRGLLILTPIMVSVIAAFTNKFQQGQKYISYRAAAEAILKEIYLYRTANQHSLRRARTLSERLAAIQRDLFRGAGGELVLTEYKDELPPYYDHSNEASDPGFNDLTGEEYLEYRLDNQLDWHTTKNLELQRDRKMIQWAILVFGGIGAFLAAWGGSLALWVAFTAAVASALVGWEELRGIDMRVGNYSQVILELNIIRDWWYTLTAEERAQDENVLKLATKTEKVLFDKNLEWASAMRKALADAEDEKAELVEHFVDEGREMTERIQTKLTDEVEELYDQRVEEVVARVETAVDDTSEVLDSMFAGISAIDEDELELPPESLADEPGELFDEAPVTETPAEAESAPGAAYPPPAEPQTLEGAVDAAIAESTLFSEHPSETPSDPAAEPEATTVSPEADESEAILAADGDLHEVWDDEEAAFDYDGDEHEDWGETEAEFDADGDLHEVWDDDEAAFDDGDTEENWEDEV